MTGRDEYADVQSEFDRVDANRYVARAAVPSVPAWARESTLTLPVTEVLTDRDE